MTRCMCITASIAMNDEWQVTHSLSPLHVEVALGCRASAIIYEKLKFMAIFNE